MTGTRARGQCACGGVTYAVDGVLRDVINCHCGRCRRFTGHHMAATSARADHVTVASPDDLLSWYFPVPEAGYGFCSRCGSSLFWRSTLHTESLSICAGTLDPPTGLATTEAWWTSQASDYHARPDLPGHATEPDAH